MARTTKKDLEEIEKEISENKSSAVSPDILRAIKTAKMSLKKKFGDDLFSEKKVEKMPSVSTGSALLDKEIGNDGWVLGRVHEIFGGPSAGKSTVVSMTCANAMRQYPDKYVIYLDYEQAMNFEYAKKLGLDVEDDRFIFLQPTSAEEGFETIHRLVETGGISTVIIDSVPAMMTQQELEKGYDEMTMGAKAKFLSTSIPKLIELIKRTQTAIIFVNQVRDTLGYSGSGQTTPGGKAIPFYSSTRIEIKRTQILTEKDVAYGQTVKFYVRKNKVGRPFGAFESDLIFGKGFDYVSETIEIAIDLGIISKAGAWLKIKHGDKDELVLQGRNGAADYYRVNEEDFLDLKQRVSQFEDSADLTNNLDEATAIVVGEEHDDEGY